MAKVFDFNHATNEVLTERGAALLLPDVLEGRIEPGRVFDRVIRLEGIPDGYRAMNDREALKVFIEF
jgi:threonine dehydrogenase-like Zn-dependent dehydrogenase